MRDRAASSRLLLTLDEDLARTFVHLGLTVGQEQTSENLVRRFMTQLIELLDRNEETYAAWHKLSEQLGQLQ